MSRAVPGILQQGEITRRAGTPGEDGHSAGSCQQAYFSAILKPSSILVKADRLGAAARWTFWIPARIRGAPSCG